MKCRLVEVSFVAPILMGACGGGVADQAGAPADGGKNDGSVLHVDATPEDDAGRATAQDASVSDGGVGGGELDGEAGALDTEGLYGSDGPQAYTSSVVQLSNAGRSWNEAIYVPSSAGLHPVVSLNCGTQQVNAGYAVYAQRLASYGIITLIQDDEGATAPTPNIVDDLTYVMSSYVPASLAGKADLTRVGLSGHSRGGKATLLAAESTLKGKVVAWFGLDPIDVDFTGSPSALPDIGTLGIPLGFAGASVSSNCSPADANYQVYYSACSPPAVALTIQGAGHMEFVEQSQAILAGLCTPSGTASASSVLAIAVHYTTAFFARELLGDSSVGAAFGGAGAPADVAAGRVQVVSK